MNIDTNLLSDTILLELGKYHDRVYRNSPPTQPMLPYVVYVLDTNIDTLPSEDYVIHVDIYDDANVSVRGMQSLADTIDNNINHKVINGEGINLHLTRDNRQFVDNGELAGKKLITMRYSTRVYYK